MIFPKKIFDYLYHDDNSFITETSKSEIQTAIKYEFFTSLTHLLLDLNYIANFFLYFFSGSKFRAQLFAMLGCCQKKRPGDLYNHSQIGAGGANHHQHQNHHHHMYRNNTNNSSGGQFASRINSPKQNAAQFAAGNDLTASSAPNDSRACARFFSKCWLGRGRKTTTTTTRRCDRGPSQNHQFFEKISLTDRNQETMNSSNFLNSNANGGAELNRLRVTKQYRNASMI